MFGVSGEETGGDWAVSDRAQKRLEGAEFARIASRYIESEIEDKPLPPRGKMLSRDEINAILRPNLPDDFGTASAIADTQPLAMADFDRQARPNSARKDFHQRQAARMASRLSLAFGQSAGLKAAVTLEQIEPGASGQALPAIARVPGAAIACFGPQGGETRAVLILPEDVADTLIARACGSPGSTGRAPDDRMLSAIDCALLERLVEPLGCAVASGSVLQAVETDASYASALMAPGESMRAVFSLRAPGVDSHVMVVTIDDEGDAETSAQVRVKKPALGRPVSAVVTARLASLSVPLSKLTSLKPGSTLLLGLPADQPAELLSGGIDGPVAFEGSVGRSGSRMAVRINRVAVPA